jgi:ribosomal-protein-alanine N-acetyltransferase
MSEFDISLARKTDCIELAELSRVAIEYGLRWRWKPSKVLELIKGPESCVIVARAPSGELMGFAAMDFMATHAHLILLATVARYRRQQVGSRLLNWLEDSASVAGVEYVSLEVRQENGSAVAFYEHHGYSIEKIKSGYYQGSEDAYRMRRDLIDHQVAKRRP